LHTALVMVVYCGIETGNVPGNSHRVECKINDAKNVRVKNTGRSACVWVAPQDLAQHFPWMNTVVDLEVLYIS
jgi:hypothetical protein